MSGNENKKRKTIGLFTDTTSNLYLKTIIQGISDAVVYLDYNLIVFVSHFNIELGDRTKVQIKSIFDMTAQAQLDGIILFSEPILYATNENYFLQLLEKTALIPKISLVYHKPGLHSILVDDRKGFYQVIDHLIKVHNKRRIAFISGVMNSIDGMTRFEIYKEVLKDNNIPFDENLFTEGNFWIAGGIMAVKTLIDERHVSFDALVSSNDYMAIAAVNELKKRGLRVPEDVAVVGFDNIPEGINSTTELTTVTQPTYAVGYKALFLLDKLIKGLPVLEKNYLDTIPVIRNSCGCNNEPDAGEQSPGLIDCLSCADITGMMIQQFKNFLPVEMEKQYSDWAYQLSITLTASINENSVDPFSDKFKELFIEKEDTLHIPAPIWNDILNRVFEYLSRTTIKNRTGFILKLYKTTQVLLREYTLKTDIVIVSFTYMANALEFLSLHLEHTMPNFINSLKTQAELFDLKSFFVSLVKDNNTLTSLYSYLDGVSETKPIDYPAEKILPTGLKGFNKRFSLILAPVYYEMEYNGFFATELGYISLDLVDHIAVKVSDIIKGIMFLDKIKDYSQNLENLVDERTAQLRNTQAELLKTAKQAGMAEIAIEVLHNVGNILNPMNITCDMLQNNMKASLVSKLQQANSLLKANAGNLAAFFNEDSRGKTLVSYYDRISNGLKEEQETIISQLGEMQQRIYRINDIIQKQQQYAMVYNLKAQFNIIQCVDNCLSILKNEIDENRITVIKDFSSGEIKIVTNESKLFHVFLEILKNSIEALKDIRKDNEERIIKISIRTESIRVIINIEDSGPGIPVEYIPKIFSQYFTTKAGHIGIGLHTSNIYMNELGGSINVINREAGRGCEVSIVLTVKEA